MYTYVTEALLEHAWKESDARGFGYERKRFDPGSVTPLRRQDLDYVWYQTVHHADHRVSMLDNVTTQFEEERYRGGRLPPPRKET
jgi:hypothetical protein